ncbi:hypothetical protein [Streptomyces abyssomicinicus]|uniref:hypothetical protein n=1 Tax=Streptomyces abyssomicinicus TaxID=574929 RepID=UPI0012501528|nr:hypothetical protein [Streptomyces abyssomicinicus]
MTGADVTESAQTPAAGKPGRGRRVAAITGAALLAVAVIGVSGFTAVTVRSADRDPGKPVFEHPEPADRKQETSEGEGLRAMLLAYGGQAGLTPGPDMGEFGSDTELTGKEAAELAKESFAELPRTQRKQLEREVDERHIEGIAMRSYTTADGWHKYALEVVLTQVEGEKNAKASAKGEREVYETLKDLGVFKAGPKVPGHEKNAWCYLLKADGDEQNESMFCVGHHGEVEAGLTADADKPIDKKDVAGLFGKQLDRIETPGEAV